MAGLSGIALPSGGVAVMEPGPDRLLLAGQATLRDVAVNEEFDLDIGESAQVTATVDRDERKRTRVALANANPSTVSVEVELAMDDGKRPEAASATLGTRNGHPLWRVSVPGNGRAVLTYGVRD